MRFVWMDGGEVGAYEGAETVRKVMVVGQLIKRSRTVFVDEKCHVVVV